MRRAAARAGVLLGLLALAACGEERDRYEAPGGDWQRLHHDPAIRALQEFIQAQRGAAVGEGKIDQTRSDWREHLPPPPRVEFSTDITYRWVLETNRGTIHFHLLAGIAPRHVANLMYLTLLGFYDGLPFFRGVKGKMMACGCPRGTGQGDPGYELAEEITKSSTHDYRGTLGFLPGHP
ncbi:MAG: peptidylprolyl isomerase, partial [Planctomycetes bacterium]|nr:peptidylprolyl isomerase [Planctomycetota bacterium]